MHIVTMILGGLVLLAVFVLGSRALDRQRAGAPTDPTWPFLVVWLAVSAIDFIIGVYWAGYSVITEIGAHVLIFGVPAAAAWFVSRRRTG